MSAAQDRRRVVITGLGVVSPLGCSARSLWQSLFEGRSGVAFLRNLPPIDGRIVYGGEASAFSGQIDDFGELEKDLKKTIRKALKMMCRESMMAVASAQHALSDAGLSEGVRENKIDPERTGVVFGSDYMLSPPEDFISAMNACGASAGKFRYEEWGGTGLGEMNPLWMLNYLPNMPASHIAIFNDYRGPNNSLTLRESSGTAAIREAAQTIARGHADCMVAGATGSRLHAFKTIHAIQSEQLADPHLTPNLASQPFDANRTGMVLGEGAGALLLEELRSAEARGAHIYAEVAGTGSAATARGKISKNADCALVLAGRAALRDADVDAASLGHLAAHASGSPAADACEARAAAELFGEYLDRLPVAAAKSAMGNLGAGSGVVEMAASVLALEAGHLYRTQNYATPDPLCRVRVSQGGESSGDSFLQWSVTPQGQACAVLIRRFC